MYISLSRVNHIIGVEDTIPFVQLIRKQIFDFFKNSNYSINQKERCVKL